MALDISAVSSGTKATSVPGPMVNPTGASSAVSSVARGSLDQLSVRPSNPLTLTSINDPLVRGIAEPPFSAEQSEYVAELLRRNPIASAHIPFIHLLHIDMFNHLDFLMTTLKEVFAGQGTVAETDFIRRFGLLAPYEKMQFAFFLLYANHQDPAVIQAMSKTLFTLPYQGMEKEAKQLILTLRSRIDSIKDKANKATVRDLNSRLKSLEMGWSVLNTFVQSTQQIDKVQYDQLFFRQQREPLTAKMNKREQIKPATLKLLSFGVQKMIQDYISLMNKLQPFHSPLINITFPFERFLKDHNVGLIINIGSALLMQEEFVNEQEFLASVLDDDNLSEIQGALGCQDQPIDELRDALSLSASCVDSIRSFNSSINTLMARIVSLDDHSHANYQQMQRDLKQTAELLGIEREPPQQEFDKVLDFLSQLDAQTGPSAIEEIPAEVDTIPLAPASSKSTPPAPAPALPRPSAPAPVTPRDKIRPRDPSIARPSAGSSSGARDVERKDAPLVISPPRFRKGMKYRQILATLREKYNVVRKRQGGGVS